jgi:hypothetical protein
MEMIDLRTCAAFAKIPPPTLTNNKTKVAPNPKEINIDTSPLHMRVITVTGKSTSEE